LILIIDSAWRKVVSMATQRLLIRLPEELARRLRRMVPARARSAFIQTLLEQALPSEESEDDPLYQVAMAVEQDEDLAAEMVEWDATSVRPDF
jgi:hypothetical protein